MNQVEQETGLVIADIKDINRMSIGDTPREEKWLSTYVLLFNC